MSRLLLGLGALLLSVGLTGCGSLSAATEDHTRLWGEVPTGLGRILEVRVGEVQNEGLRSDILQAVRREFVRGGLFDRVRPVAQIMAELVEDAEHALERQSTFLKR